MRKVLVLAAAASVALPLGAAASASAGTLDQQQSNGGGLGYGVTSNESVAQTFTAGASGGIDQVDLYIYNVGGTPTAPLTVQIRDAYGGAPGSTVLASQSVPGTALTNSAVFRPINFTPAAPVTAGTLYTIVALTAAVPAVSYGWGGSSTADPYAGGAGFLSGGSASGPWTPITAPAADLAFKTYVAPPVSSVPTGQRAAALRRCKKRAHKHHWSKKRLRKCKKTANLLPI